MRTAVDRQKAGPDDELYAASFCTDATPPIGSPVAYARTRSISDPLTARGIVLLPGTAQPIVLCAVDWICISNSGYAAWREALAEAAGTSPARVAVHHVHQHDGPRCDFAVEALLAKHGLGEQWHDPTFARAVIARTKTALQQALQTPRRITHLGVGQSRVDKVASNRRLLDAEGKVKRVRMSRCQDAEAIAAPEGVIDPRLNLISLWSGHEPIACLSYYATHPQSYYGQGDVTAEFVGLARACRERALNGLPHIHFNGAGGNVAAGKYNDGSPEMRPILTERMASAMAAAWEASERIPVTAADVAWAVCPVTLPPAEHLAVQELEQILGDVEAESRARLTAARKLVFLKQTDLELSCLHIKQVRVLHMPGELFVEYQLAAQAMRPDLTVCMAAYGNRSPGYIGTEIAYSQGGYETSPRCSYTAPAVEGVLTAGMKELLG